MFSFIPLAAALALSQAEAPVEVPKPTEQAPAIEPAPTIEPASVIALFDRFCLARRVDRSGYQAVEWDDFPRELSFMNTYGHGGDFLRSDGPPQVYVARTRGSGHLDPNAVETRCGIAVRTGNAEAVAAALGERVETRPTAPLEMGGMTTWMLIGQRGGYTVTRGESDWVIVRGLGFALPVRR